MENNFTLSARRYVFELLTELESKMFEVKCDVLDDEPIKSAHSSIKHILEKYATETGMKNVPIAVSETEYEKGYTQALLDINKPMAVIQEKYNPSTCPRCKKSYYDYEECDDGYYDRATSLERCPFCGQALDWWG